jgi:DNA end-binding protein Ku
MLLAHRLQPAEDMPPRALWKGSISFGLVTVPISLVSASEPRETLAFNLLHRKDRSRIVEKRVCVKEDVEVSWKDIVKGYQYAKDRYVVVTDEDFAKVRVPATQTFDIRRFVPAADVEDLYFNHPYYVTPQGKSAVKAYALLRDALRAAGKLAIGTIVLRQREHLAALEPVDEALVLTTMRYAHEIRRQKDLGLPASGKGWSDSEMKLARQLIDTLAGEWDPAEYRDTYSEALRRVIKAKVEGKETTAQDLPAPARVTDLMEALKRSLKERPRALASAGGRRLGASRKTTRARRTAA